MEKSAEKPLSQVTGNDRGLSALVRMGRVYDELDRHLQPLLPESCRGQIRVACVDGDCLVLAAASPAWSSRARLEAAGLLEAATRLWPGELTRTRVIVHAASKP